MFARKCPVCGTPYKKGAKWCECERGCNLEEAENARKQRIAGAAGIVGFSIETVRGLIKTFAERPIFRDPDDPIVVDSGVFIGLIGIVFFAIAFFRALKK